MPILRNSQAQLEEEECAARRVGRASFYNTWQKLGWDYFSRISRCTSNMELEDTSQSEIAEIIQDLKNKSTSDMTMSIMPLKKVRNALISTSRRYARVYSLQNLSVRKLFLFIKEDLVVKSLTLMHDAHPSELAGTASSSTRARRRMRGASRG
jgi:hypothetical protein